VSTDTSGTTLTQEMSGFTKEKGGGRKKRGPFGKKNDLSVSSVMHVRVLGGGWLLLGGGGRGLGNITKTSEP